jgi:hypothetical protein
LRKVLERVLSLNIEASLENLRRRSVYRELRETGRMFSEMAHLYLRELC